MVKIKKTYRLQESTVMEIQEIKEMVRQSGGTELSDSQIVQMAVYDYWIQYPRWKEGNENDTDA